MQNDALAMDFCHRRCAFAEIVLKIQASHALLAFDKYIGTVVLDLSYITPNPNSMSF